MTSSNHQFFSNKNPLKRCAVSALWLAMFGSAAPQAQLLEEVVVTAAKREMTLQETPIAVSVVGAEQLEQANIKDLIDLQSAVTSLRVEQRANSQNTNFFIRGFGNGDNNPGIEPSVGVFIDGVYRSRSAASISDLPNVERIEMLRGPQSTLFGKNASAGVISIVTKRPEFELGGNLELSYGNFNSTSVKGDITGPISDKVAYRLAGGINKRDGYFDVVNLGTESNERDRWDVRGDLLIEASEDLTVRVLADYSKLDEICCGGANIINGPTGGLINLLAGGVGFDAEDPFSFDLYQNKESQNEIENSGFSVQVDYDMDELTFTSITAYREVDAFLNDDNDFTAADLIGGTGGETTDIETFTQEFRLTSSFGGPVNFLLGAYIFDEKIDYGAEVITGSQFRAYGDALLQAAAGIDANTVEALLGLPNGTMFNPSTGMRENYQLDNEAFSLFGSLDIEVSDRLIVTLGANYTEDEKSFKTNVTTDDVFSSIALPDAFAGLRAFQFLPPFLNVPNAVEDGKTSDDNWSYTLRASFDLTDNINLYATWATGFKASSVNLSRDSRPLASDISAINAAGIATPNLVSGTRFADPEKSEVYEIGLKGSFEKGSVNIAVFDQTIEDFQSNVFTGLGFALSNAEEQSTFGVEFEGNYFPTEALELSLGVTYLDPKFDSFPNSAFGDLSGETPANIPEWAVSLGATHRYELNNGAQMTSRINYYYEDEVKLRDGGFDSVPVSVSDNITREVKDLNASVTVEFAEGYQISVWGRNLLDDEYLVGAFDTTVQGGSVTGYPSQPRTYGITGRYKF